MVATETSRAGGVESTKVDKVTGKDLLLTTEAAKIHVQNTDSQLVNGTHTVSLDANGNLLVENIVQNGSSYVTHAEQVYTAKDTIILRDGAVSGLATGAYAGLTAKKYDGVNDGQLVFDKDGFARVGDVGSLVKLAAIQETPTDAQFVYYDAATYSLKTRAFASGDITGALGFTPLATRSFGTAANNNTGDFEVPLTFSTGLTRTGNTITNNITQYTNAMAVSAQSTAGTSTTGLLSSTDWNTFNGKQAALGFTPYNATNPSNYITISSVPVVATIVPVMSGVAAIGASGKWADGAHVHPVDTSRLSLAGGTMTGGITNSTSINPLTTLAESWIGPTSTTGIYFKGNNIGIGVTLPGYSLDILSVPSVSGVEHRGLNVTLSPTYSTANSFNSLALSGTLQLNGTQNNTGRNAGISGAAYNSGSGTVNNIYGLFFSGGNLSTGTVTNFQGIHVENYSPGAGNITNLSGIYIAAMSIAGTPTSVYGVNITANTTVQGTTKYGLYIGNQSGATTNYSIYTGTATSHFGGNVEVSGVFMPQQAPTASAPAYVKGGMYFDTTLNKLRVGGATAWETITSV